MNELHERSDSDEDDDLDDDLDWLITSEDDKNNVSMLNCCCEF